MANLAEGSASAGLLDSVLVGCVERGDVLDLSGDEVVDDATMQAWGESRTVSATLVRDIVRGRLVADPDPRGLRLRGARIRGRIDLTNVTSTVTVELIDCLLEQGLAACNANLPAVILAGCRLEHPNEPALDATRIATTMLDLQHARVVAHTARGAIVLNGARLDVLDCTGANMRNDSGPVFFASRVRVDQGVFLNRGFVAVGAGEQGTVRFLGANLGGLDCSGASLRNDSGPALHAERLRVDQSLFTRGRSVALETGNDSGPALHADNLRVEDMSLRTGFEAIGASKLGAVRLLGAQIGGMLDFAGAKLLNDSGPALHADNLRVDQDMFLCNGFEASGCTEEGTIRLTGAHVGGTLDFASAKLRNDSGSALEADNLHVGGDAFLNGSFEAIGSSKRGVIRLLGAHVGGVLGCAGAKLRNDSGPALAADSLRVDDGVYLRTGFDAVGAAEAGAVRIPGAHVRGVLDCRGAKLRNGSGPALVADGLQVDRNVLLGDGFEAVGAGTDVAVRLSQVRIGGTFVFDPSRLEHRTNPPARLNLDGLAYSGLPRGMSIDEWLRLVRDGTPEYAAQPYQHLAAACRAAGHDREARRVLMTQRRDQIYRRALSGRAERTWARFTGLTLGYGYQPWRAMLGLLAALVTAVVLAVILGGHGGLAKIQAPTVPCTVIERVGVGLDLGTPLLTTGARARCETTSTITGQILTITGWALRLLAWAFATLLIAGFTGAVRKT